MKIPHLVHSLGKAVLVVVAGALVSCSNGGDSITAPANRIASVEVLPPPTSLLVGESFTLTAVARNSSGTQPSTAPLIWKSSNNAVASVVQGVVTARSEGVTDISAEADGKSGSVKIVVTSTQRLVTPDVYADGIIGFTSSRNSAGLDVYIVGPAGIQQVTTSEDYEQFDGWSPDGARVAVIRSPIGQNEITSHILNADGTGDVLVSRGVVNWAPDWLHRGSIVDGKIVVSNFDGSGEHQVGSAGADLFGPWWSPDGTRVAFGYKPSASELADIYVANVDGSGLLNVTQTANLSEEFAGWSPDGTKLAITGENQGAGVGSGLFTVNANGTNRVQLTSSISPRGDYEPEWSPDGKHIAFTTYFGSTFGIFVIDPGGGQSLRITPTSLFAGFGHWSPDGTRIAFTAFPENIGRQAVFVATLDRKSITQVTRNSSDNLGPFWRPRQ